MRSAVLDPTTMEHASQARDGELLVMWQHPRTRQICPVGRLAHVGNQFQFRYTRAARDIEDFRPLLGYPELTEIYSSDQLPALLEQRVMSPRRPDFGQYVGMLGLSADHATPWEQVVASGGGRAGDTLQFMRLPTAEDGRARAQFLCNGIRHIPGYRVTLRGRTIRVTREEQDRALDGLRAGSRLHLEPEPDNPEDANSVLVMAQDVPLGWVPRLLAPSMGELMASGVTDVTVHRAAPDAPAHLRLVLELDAPAPPGFTFDPEGRWEPLAVQG